MSDMKVTHKEFDEAVQEYYNNHQAYKFLRFGQYLMNTLTFGEQNKEIFYEVDDRKARNLFLVRYVL